MRVCLCSANYVADVAGYSVQPFDWGRCEFATVEAFSGSGWADRFAALLGRCRRMGFDAIEVWQAHLRAGTATPEQLALARRLLADQGLRCASYTSFFSSPRTPAAEVERAFAVASSLGAPVIAGGMHRELAPLVDGLSRRYGVKMAIENHGESAEDLAALLAELPAEYADTIGTTVDTGIYAGQGLDPVAACRLLKGRIFHVHFKDVRAAGAHECCAAGAGIARLREVAAELAAQGYRGFLSVECETVDHDPDPETRESLARALEWTGPGRVA